MEPPRYRYDPPRTSGFSCGPCERGRGQGLSRRRAEETLNRRAAPPGGFFCLRLNRVQRARFRWLAHGVEWKRRESSLGDRKGNLAGGTSASGPCRKAAGGAPIGLDRAIEAFCGVCEVPRPEPLNIPMARVRIVAPSQKRRGDMTEERDFTTAEAELPARARLRPVSDDGLSVAVLRAGARPPGERRSAVDRRRGRDRRSLRRLEQCLPHPDRRREDRRGHAVSARDFAVGWDQGPLRRRLNAWRQLARKE
jgi:hypothetical protein